MLQLHRPHRYPVRVDGVGLKARGIRPGDLCVVCTAAEPTPGRVVIAFVGGERLVAVLARDGAGWCLTSGRPDGRALALPDDAAVWGVVVALIRPQV